MGIVGGSRPKHPDKDLEKVLRSVEDQGWRVARGAKYYKMYCPCKDEHLKTMHLTPSNPKYLLNLHHWLRRTGCWKEDQ